LSKAPPHVGADAAEALSANAATIKVLEAHVETLKEQLAAAEARAEKQTAELSADLTAEKAKTEKAIAAFAALAERLDALAAERARPWWRRLVG
jgi:septal ring factor EnvC (AmiA/AmiB activator)